MALGKRPVSYDTESRIRLYVQQVAEGKTPSPLSIQEIRPTYDSPADVPLTEDVLQALAADPISDDTLALLADCLASNGIPQTVLAQWWGLRYKFYQDLRYGRKSVPRMRANHLRDSSAFGLSNSCRRRMNTASSLLSRFRQHRKSCCCSMIPIFQAVICGRCWII